MSADLTAHGAATGVIHDLGYRRFDGPRLGRRHITVALAWHSFRSAFGFGRGARAKIVPAIALVALCLPAAVNAFAVSRGDPRLFSYDTYVPVLRTLVMTVFVAVQAPELVSRDIRSHVLPLYFSRPLRTIDYPLAKYLAFTAACLVMVEVPLLLMYGGTIASLHGGAAVWAQTRALLPGMLVGVMWAAVMSAIGLLLASFTGRRAFATGAVAIFFFLTWTLASILIQIEKTTAFKVGQAGVPPPLPPAASSAEKLVGLFSPFTLFDGVRRWLGGTTPDQVPRPGGLGVLYAATLLVLLAAALAGLAARYRKAALS
jgi:ABC-2 type transport system permease protein